MAPTHLLAVLPAPPSTRHGLPASRGAVRTTVSGGQRPRLLLRCGAVSTRKQAASAPVHSAVLPTSGLLGDTAVVIGASVAGLLSACALARHYSSVVVIDKDATLPGAAPSDAAPSPRRGVPQSSQPHVMLTKGFQLMKSFLPTFSQDLLDAGALPVDWVTPDCKVGTGGGWMTPAEQKGGAKGKLVSVSTSRYMLESTLRRAVARTVPNITWLPGTCIKGLLHDRGAVRGVFLGDGTPLAADLTVHAAGRSAPAAAWLLDAGLVSAGVMQLEVVDAQLVYATREYVLPATAPVPSWKVVVYQADMPRTRRIGYVARIEGRRLVATLGGYQHDVPWEAGATPQEREAAWLRSASSLHDGGAEFLGALQHAVPVTGLMSHAGTANVRRRYPPVPGLVHAGDCVMALDPAFGQGLSCAALAADALRTQLAACASDRRRVAMAAHHLAVANAKLPAGCEHAWRMAVAQDARFCVTTSAPSGLMMWYLNAMRRRAHVDPAVSLAMVEALHFFAPPTALIAPRVAARVLAAEAHDAMKRLLL